MEEENMSKLLCEVFANMTREELQKAASLMVRDPRQKNKANMFIQYLHNAEQYVHIQQMMTSPPKTTPTISTLRTKQHKTTLPKSEFSRNIHMYKCSVCHKYNIKPNKVKDKFKNKNKGKWLDIVKCTSCLSRQYTKKNQRDKYLIRNNRLEKGKPPPTFQKWVQMQTNDE